MLPQIKIIASRIKELRTILEISEADIAEKLGIPLEQYLMYESGAEEIPISALYNTAEILGVDATVLLSGDAPRMLDYTVVRRGQGMTVERYEGYRFSSLAYNYIGRVMEPMIVSLLPGDKKPELVSHEGQEFNIVLSGKVAVTIGARVHILEKGDSIYFNPSIPHGQSAVDEPADFLTVITL